MPLQPKTTFHIVNARKKEKKPFVFETALRQVVILVLQKMVKKVI